MKAFVTGGGGFLGTAIVRTLRARGDQVVSYSRSAHPHLAELGIEQIQGDIADARKLRSAMIGTDVVFHTAAKAGIFGPQAEFERTNLAGTSAVLAATLENKIPRLVHTSSPSVCFDGRDHVDASNDLPYTTIFLSAYAETKAKAERLALGANGRGQLATVALRPHLLFGPGDPHLVPRVLSRARAGRLFAVGKRTNRVSLTFIENAAHAHVLAADRLTTGAPHAGKAYFLAQEEPVVLWDWLDELVRSVGAGRVRGRVPYRLAFALGAACETLWTVARARGEPPMTRFLAQQLARSHTYDLGPARRDFDYEEQVGLAEATRITIASLRGDHTAVPGAGAGVAGTDGAGAAPVVTHHDR